MMHTIHIHPDAFNFINNRNGALDLVSLKYGQTGAREREKKKEEKRSRFSASIDVQYFSQLIRRKETRRCMYHVNVS